MLSLWRAGYLNSSSSYSRNYLCFLHHFTCDNGISYDMNVEVNSHTARNPQLTWHKFANEWQDFCHDRLINRTELQIFKIFLERCGEKRLTWTFRTFSNVCSSAILEKLINFFFFDKSALVIDGSEVVDGRFLYALQLLGGSFLRRNDSRNCTLLKDDSWSFSRKWIENFKSSFY